jgi:hypothetical protein
VEPYLVTLLISLSYCEYVPSPSAITNIPFYYQSYNNTKNQGFTRLNITIKHYWLTQYIFWQIMPSSGDTIDSRLIKIKQFTDSIYISAGQAFLRTILLFLFVITKRNELYFLSICANNVNYDWVDVLLYQFIGFWRKL